MTGHPKYISSHHHDTVPEIKLENSKNYLTKLTKGFFHNKRPTRGLKLSFTS
jgi:hypothetical protein